ncbi:MAG: hypothetical protein EOP14_00095 [Pseudomonas sp.]|nr:MAG: hypothetical protein EOP14_00095 [Pseudomonas sp.]
MARTDSTKVKWIVQFRKGRGLKWLTRKGSFETRDAARWQAMLMRTLHAVEVSMPGGRTGQVTAAGYGFGNTRIQRHIRGEKK